LIRKVKSLFYFAKFKTIVSRGEHHTFFFVIVIVIVIIVITDVDEYDSDYGEEHKIFSFVNMVRDCNQVCPWP
jgi:hypothetical protein